MGEGSRRNELRNAVEREGQIPEQESSATPLSSFHPSPFTLSLSLHSLSPSLHSLSSSLHSLSLSSFTLSISSFTFSLSLPLTSRERFGMEGSSKASSHARMMGWTGKEAERGERRHDDEENRHGHGHENSMNAWDHESMNLLMLPLSESTQLQVEKMATEREGERSRGGEREGKEGRREGAKWEVGRARGDLGDGGDWVEAERRSEKMRRLGWEGGEGKVEGEGVGFKIPSVKRMRRLKEGAADDGKESVKEMNEGEASMAAGEHNDNIWSHKQVRGVPQHHLFEGKRGGGTEGDAGAEREERERETEREAAGVGGGEGEGEGEGGRGRGGERGRETESERALEKEGAGEGKVQGKGEGEEGERGALSLESMTPLVCQVDGCQSDGEGAKEYHRRHRVCVAHSRAVSAIVGGVVQRFCQQCSRFHAPTEFDHKKRSCRRRLAGHNRRRRKGQSAKAALLAGLITGSHVAGGEEAGNHGGREGLKMLSPQNSISPLSDPHLSFLQRNQTSHGDPHAALAMARSSPIGTAMAADSSLVNKSLTALQEQQIARIRRFPLPLPLSTQMLFQDSLTLPPAGGGGGGGGGGAAMAAPGGLSGNENPFGEIPTFGSNTGEGGNFVESGVDPVEVRRRHLIQQLLQETAGGGGSMAPSSRGEQPWLPPAPPPPPPLPPPSSSEKMWSSDSANGSDSGEALALLNSQSGLGTIPGAAAAVQLFLQCGGSVDVVRQLHEQQQLAQLQKEKGGGEEWSGGMGMGNGGVGGLGGGGGGGNKLEGNLQNSLPEGRGRGAGGGGTIDFLQLPQKGNLSLEAQQVMAGMMPETPSTNGEQGRGGGGGGGGGGGVGGSSSFDNYGSSPALSNLSSLTNSSRVSPNLSRHSLMGLLYQHQQQLQQGSSQKASPREFDASTNPNLNPKNPNSGSHGGSSLLHWPRTAGEVGRDDIGSGLGLGPSPPNVGSLNSETAASPSESLSPLGGSKLQPILKQQLDQSSFFVPRPNTERIQ